MFGAGNFTPFPEKLASPQRETAPKDKNGRKPNPERLGGTGRKLWGKFFPGPFFRGTHRGLRAQRGAFGPPCWVWPPGGAPKNLGPKYWAGGKKLFPPKKRAPKKKKARGLTQPRVEFKAPQIIGGPLKNPVLLFNPSPGGPLTEKNTGPGTGFPSPIFGEAPGGKDHKGGSSGGLNPPR